MNCLLRRESRVFYLSWVGAIKCQYSMNELPELFETVMCWCLGRSRIFPGWLNLSSQTKTCTQRTLCSLLSTPCEYASQSAFTQRIFILYSMIYFLFDEFFAQNLFLLQVYDLTHFFSWCFASQYVKTKDWNKLL